MKLAVDIVLFGYVEKDLKVLLIKRSYEPFENQWAFPGGFVLAEETLEEAVSRKLKEETDISEAYTEQLYTFGAVQRDPRQRVVSVAYYGLIKPEQAAIHSTYYANEIRWFSVSKLPKLAFDHQTIFDAAYQRLQAKLSYQPVGFELLPNKFTLTELQTLYETILNKSFDKRNFRKKLVSLDVLQETNETQDNVPHTRAKLYSFDRQKYQDKTKHGFYFEL